MEPEGSLPCSQQPATGLYLEPDASTPHPPPCFPKIGSNIIILRLYLPDPSLPSMLPDRNFVCIFLPMRAICLTYLILFDLMTL